MVMDSLFAGLPPPSGPQETPAEPLEPTSSVASIVTHIEPVPAVKSALAASGSKRGAKDVEPEGEKRVRFKTTVDASAEQVLSAMHKIAVHISNPSKFNKASKLAVQLLEGGSVTSESADPFFGILKAAMAPPSRATESSTRADYLALFEAVQEQLECFSASQQAQVDVWLIWVQVGNDLKTDDSFVFSKAAGRLRQAIDALPDATEEDLDVTSVPDTKAPPTCSDVEVPEGATGEADPFGLNAFLPKLSKKEERLKRKKDEEAAARKASEDAGRLLGERREALLGCLKIAADRYKLPWAQTIIDITVKHANDNVVKFTSSQRAVVEALWVSVRDQQTRRRQGKVASDITPFERLQAKYAVEKISIRKAVGSGGGRSAEQWLG